MRRRDVVGSLFVLLAHVAARAGPIRRGIELTAIVEPPLGNLTAVFEVMKPDGVVLQASVLTDLTGIARSVFRLKRNDVLGIYHTLVEVNYQGKIITDSQDVSA